MRALPCLSLLLVACAGLVDPSPVQPLTPPDVGPGPGPVADAGYGLEVDGDVPVDPPGLDGGDGFDAGAWDAERQRDGGAGQDAGSVVGGARDAGSSPDVDSCPAIQELVLATDADPVAPPKVALLGGRVTALYRNERGLQVVVVEADDSISERHDLGQPQAIDPVVYARPFRTQLLWIDPTPEGAFLVDQQLGGPQGRVRLDAPGPLRLATTIEGNGAVLALALGTMSGVSTRLLPRAIEQSPISLPFGLAPQNLGETPPLAIVEANLGPLVAWVSASLLHLRVVVPPDVPTLREQDPAALPGDSGLVPHVSMSSRPNVMFGWSYTAQTVIIGLPDPNGVEVRQWDFRVNETDHAVSRTLRSSLNHFSTSALWAPELNHTLVAAPEAEPGVDPDQRRISLWGLDASGNFAPVVLPPRFISAGPVGTDARFPAMAWRDGELALIYVTDTQEVRLIRAAACALSGP